MRYCGTFGRISGIFGSINKYNPHMANPIEMGIDKLSSAKPNEIFSTIAPIADAIKPIKYSVK